MEKKLLLMMLLCMFFLKPELVNAKMLPMLRLEEDTETSIDLDGDGKKEVLKYVSEDKKQTLYINNKICLEGLSAILLAKDQKNDSEKELGVLSYENYDNYINGQSEDYLVNIDVYHYENNNLKSLFHCTFSAEVYGVGGAGWFAGDGKMCLPSGNYSYKTYKIVNDQFYELEENAVLDCSDIARTTNLGYCRSKSYPVQKGLKNSKTKFNLNCGDTFTLLKLVHNTDDIWFYIRTDRGKEGWIKAGSGPWMSTAIFVYC